MPELYTHMARAVAKAPREQWPQLTAEAAAFLQEQFKEKRTSFAENYQHITEALAKEKTTASPEIASPAKPQTTVMASHREHLAVCAPQFAASGYQLAH